MANSGTPIDTAKLRLARQRKGWTVRDVSQRCRELGTPVDFGAYSRYERGLTDPGPGRLLAIAQALDLTVDELLLPEKAPGNAMEDVSTEDLTDEGLLLMVFRTLMGATQEEVADLHAQMVTTGAATLAELVMPQECAV
jgi:transcriptional regulator with XRE-family HTH domain